MSQDQHHQLLLHTAESAYDSLRRAGYQVQLTYTVAPKAEAKGEARVVRHRFVGRNVVELVCAFPQLSLREV